jgi:hypothetical protein
MCAILTARRWPQCEVLSRVLRRSLLAKRTLRWGLETSDTEGVMTPLMVQAHDAQTLH